MAKYRIVRSKDNVLGFFKYEVQKYLKSPFQDGSGGWIFRDFASSIWIAKRKIKNMIEEDYRKKQPPEVLFEVDSAEL